jgi:hypothetical protein
MARNRDYEVGYAKPPRHRQFKKGNPGRPKGRCRTAALSAEEARQRVLTQGVALTKDGRRTIVCGIEALYQQLLAKALNGDVQAATLLLKGGPANENEAKAISSNSDNGTEGAPDDAALIERYLRREGWRREQSEGEGGDHE